jgi:hypothetical protein
MSDIQFNVSFPLDDDGFLRRECPLCNREFKVKPTTAELQSDTERTAHALLAQEAESNPDAEGEEDSGPSERWCPYCGQQAPASSWWTQQQVAYLNVFARNVMARLVNEHFIRPMKRQFGGQRGGLVSIEFKGNEMDEQDPWISPEPNDMTRFALPCCERELKIENTSEIAIHCFFCGFQHPRTP